MTLYAADLYSEPVITGTTGELAEAFAADGAVGLEYVPRNRQLIKDITTGAEYVGDGVTAFSALSPLPGGGSDGLPIAYPVGVTTEQMDNPLDEGATQITVLVFPADAPALAIKLADDENVRWLLFADAEDGLYLGDGTFNPWDEGIGFQYDSANNAINFTTDVAVHKLTPTSIAGTAEIACHTITTTGGDATFGQGVTVDGQLTLNGDFHATEINSDLAWDQDFGPVVHSPDQTAYRIVVANGGAVSAVAV